MATKKKDKPVDYQKLWKKLHRQYSRLDRLHGLLWVYRCAEPVHRAKLWDEIVALHDTHRHAVARGR